MPTEVEYLRSQIADVKRKLLSIQERKDEYAEKTAIPLDLIRGENELRERLTDLERRLDTACGGAKPQVGVARPAPDVAEAMKKVYVDRDEERRLFREMVSGDTAIHILLLEAEGGMGKTILLDQFWEISEGLKRARVDFKQSSYSVAGILREMSEQYGANAFTMFYEVCCDTLRELGQQDVKNTSLLWSAMDLRLSRLGAEDRLRYQQLITEAFVANLEAILDKDRTIVLLFDTLEKASESTKTWIVSQLVDAARHRPWLVCVFAGRETPRITTNDANWCLQHSLQRLSDEQAREYIQKVVYTQDENIVTFITVHAAGHPYTLQQLVLTYLTKYLPKKSAVPNEQ